MIEVAFTGRWAHSAQSALGVNAVTHLRRLLAAVEAHDAGLAAGPGHPIAGTGSLMATVAAGGSSPFLVPATASAVIERRTVPGERVADCLAEVEHILRQMHRDDPAIQATAAMSLSREA